MAYEKTNWVDGVTPVNAANLNKIEAEVVRLSEENDTFAETFLTGPADLNDEQKDQWKANLGIENESQVTLQVGQIVNGVPGNDANTICVCTGTFNVSNAETVRIYTNRPVNDGCMYTVGYLFSDNISVFGADGFGFLPEYGFISRVHAHQDVISDKKNIAVPDGAKFARFSMTMYNTETKEYVPVRVSDFIGYDVFITYKVAQEEQSLALKEKYPDAVSNVYAAARFGLNSNGKENTNKRFALLATTDVHAYKKGLETAVEFVNDMLCFDCAATLGDIAEGHYNDTDGTWYSGIIFNSSVPWLTVIGNHDMGNTANVGESATQAQAFDRWIAPNLGIAGVESETSYYYKDFADYSLRLIVLNAYDTPDTIGDDGNFVVNRKVQCISQAQADWLVSTLAATPADYTVSVLMHSNPGTGVKDADVPFNHATMTFDNQDTQGTLIPEIIDAWMKGAALNKAFASTNGNVPSVDVSADFASRGAGAFAGYILGHMHRDLVGHVDGYDGQKLYGFSATAVGNWQNGLDDLPRVVGHRSNDVITAVCIDTAARKVYLVRIGSDISFDLNRRGPVAISY